MGNPFSLKSKVTWERLIEYLAKFEHIELSTLHDSINYSSLLPHELSKNTRERIALRKLEHLFGPIHNAAPSVPNGKCNISFSESCEDVLNYVTQKSQTSGSDLMKGDVRLFILHKRASLPLCALEQLKHVIPEAISYPTPVIGRSRLVHTSDDSDRSPVDFCNMPSVGNSNVVPPENENVIVRDDSCVKNLLPFKRNQSDFTCKNSSQDFQESQDCMHDGDLHVNAKRHKQNSSCATQSVKQIPVPQHGNQLAENSSERIGGDTGKGSQDAERECRVGKLDECRSLENDDGRFFSTNRLGQSPDASAIDQFQHNPYENTDSANKMRLDTSGDGSHLYFQLEEVNKDGHGALNKAPVMNIQQKVSFDEAKDDGKQCMQLKTSNAPPLSGSLRNITDDKAGGMEHLCKQCTTSDVNQYHLKKVDSMKKNRFLSSRCTVAGAFPAIADQKKPYSCLKCSKCDQVLVCSAVGCSLVFHEKCLGPSLSFDEKGNFCCPFCAYSHAIQRYSEAKKKESLAKEELHVFVNQIPK